MLERLVEVEKEKAKRSKQHLPEDATLKKDLAQRAEWTAKWQIVLENLARIENIVIETESQSILNYIINPATFLRGLTKGSLIINRGQIIDITAKKIIVQDNFPNTASFARVNKILDKEKLIALTKEH